MPCLTSISVCEAIFRGLHYPLSIDWHPMRLSELRRIDKADGQAHGAVLLLPLHQLDRFVQRLFYQSALLLVCRPLSHACISGYAIIQFRLGEVGECLDTRRSCGFSCLLRPSQMLAYLSLGESAQSQFEVGKIALKVAHLHLVVWHDRAMRSLDSAERRLEVGNPFARIALAERKPQVLIAPQPHVIAAQADEMRRFLIGALARLDGMFLHPVNRLAKIMDGLGPVSSIHQTMAQM